MGGCALSSCDHYSMVKLVSLTEDTVVEVDEEWGGGRSRFR
jgi:hypothetical protein